MIIIMPKLRTMNMNVTWYTKSNKKRIVRGPELGQALLIEKDFYQYNVNKFITDDFTVGLYKKSRRIGLSVVKN